MTAWRWCALCVTAVVASVAPVSYLAAQAPVAAARAYRERHETELLTELREFAAIPNVASDSVGIRRNVRALVAMLERRGVVARVLETG